ncbi:MAG: TRAP transporter substrate-binding protein [Hirschia sp.]|nr:TRAP transporter substrate-binding protein [Hirschia sp.]MBF17641.1 TRAP transporter substrate-binding protein [Hirschia sp.]
MKDFLKRYWWAFLVGVGMLVLAFSLLEPPPPKHVVMASGSPGGAYQQVAARYREALGNKNVEVEVLDTSGSIDNISRLLSGEADIAILQTGLVSPVQAESLLSLGAVYYEPLWIFHRKDFEMTDLRDLQGMTVALGEEGSGARALGMMLIADNGLTEGEITISPLGGSSAAQALMADEIDAALMVASPDADWVMQLASNPDVSLLSLERALAYSRRHPFLKNVVLPDGALSLSDDLPVKNIDMIAPYAQIVVRDDLHPAIQSLLLESMSETHGKGSLLAPPGEFPAAVEAGLSMSSEAKRYYEKGPSFLRRYFPFDVANFLERAWVLLIPLITLAFPIVKGVPPLYRWRIRRRIYIWYRDLRLLENEGRAATSEAERRAVRARLAELMAETGNVEVPDSYTDDLYRLRAHIRFVAELVDRLGHEDAAAHV